MVFGSVCTRYSGRTFAMLNTGEDSAGLVYVEDKSLSSQDTPSKMYISLFTCAPSIAHI